MSAVERLLGLFVSPRAEAVAGTPAAERPSVAAGAEPAPARCVVPAGGGAGLALVPSVPHVGRARPDLRLVDGDGGAVAAPYPSEPRPGGSRATPSSGERPGGSDAAPPPSLGAEDALRVCVVGDERVALGVARALTTALARRRGVRCAVLCRTWADAVEGAAAPAEGRPASRFARRAARGLVADGLVAVARGRIVELELEGPERTGSVPPLLGGRLPGTPVVTLLAAARRARPDALSGGYGLIVLALPATAPSALVELAAAELRSASADARVVVLSVPVRLGLTARRAAVAQALAELP